jgi:ATP-dependent DNA helicase PIF1
MELSPEQERALDMAIRGENVVLHGSAGTGKSYVLRTITSWAKANNKVISVTAYTGTAAQNLDIPNAGTLHSWAGIGLGAGTVDELIVKVRNGRAKQRWEFTEILIIDEMSMIQEILFTKLDRIGKAIRGRPDLPFGGIQVILSGDFYQIPPVDNKGGHPHKLFAFESTSWQAMFPRKESIVHFDTIFRQRDPVFRAILQDMRVGVCTEESQAVLRARCIPAPVQASGIKPTRIFSKRLDVAVVNQMELALLPGEEKMWRATWSVDPPAPWVTSAMVTNRLDMVDKNGQYDVELRLRVGAQVVMKKNDKDRGLVNGSRGIVLSLNDGGNPVVRFLNGSEFTIVPASWEVGKVEGTDIDIIRTQIPLRLAYAATVHSSQGQTLDFAEVDLGSSIFEAGQAYVAASRLQTIEGMFISAFNPAKIRAHPKVTAWVASMKKEDEEEDKADEGEEDGVSDPDPDQ